jgi:hypothetical protein
MSQPVFFIGLNTHTLPYPQTYQQSTVARSADFVSYTGTVKRDFVASALKYQHYVQMGWSDLAEADLQTIIDFWLDAIQDFSGWSYTDPAGTAYTVYPNPDSFNLATTRYAGVSGEVLYTARLNLVGNST